MDKNLVDLAYGLLSELFKSEDQTTPQKVSAVTNWLLRNIHREEINAALERHFNEVVGCVFFRDEDFFAPLRETGGKFRFSQ